MENKVNLKQKNRKGKDKVDKRYKLKYKNRSRFRGKNSRMNSISKIKEMSRNRNYKNDSDSDSSSTHYTKQSKARSKSSSKNKNRRTKDYSYNFASMKNGILKNFSSVVPSDSYIPISNTTSDNMIIYALALPQAAQFHRKLYIGNLPTGITPSTLVKLLNAALILIKATETGDPVISASINIDGHYAFVEFRSSEEAKYGFLLNNFSILGKILKVGTPVCYTGTLSMMEDGNLCNTAGIMNAPIKDTKIQFPTRVLCFKGVTCHLNIENEETFQDVYEDFREECSKFGNVVSFHIPRKDLENNPSPGMRNIYVEFNALEESKRARKELSGRKYDKHTVQISYYSEEKYTDKDFELNL